MKRLLPLAALVALASPSFADDHGPVFGYATPVNSQGEVSCDAGLFGRNGTLGTQLSTATACGYGITPHLTFKAFLPASFGTGSLPESRLMPGGEWSGGLSWRFLHSVTGVGRRLESTATVAAVVAGPQPDSGPLGQLHRAPGVDTNLAAGYASRSHYVWFGGGYTAFAQSSGDRRPQTASWSAVYGYRPKKLRRGYNQWDYRGFAELTGEHTSSLRLRGDDLPNSNTTGVWLGPSILAIFKDVAIEGGAQAPLYREASDSLFGRERVRFAINFSYLKYSSRNTSH